MKNALKNILVSVLFAFGFFVLLFIFSRLFNPKDNFKENGIVSSEELAYGILAEKDETIDTLIIGDSCVYSAINPIQIWHDTGFSSYCISTPGQKISYTEYLFEKAMKKQTPKLVIFESDTFFQEYEISNQYYYRMSQIFPVFHYHDRWKTLLLKDLDIFTAPKYTNTVNSKGYYFSCDVKPIKKDIGFGKKDSKVFLESIDMKTRSTIKGMVKKCEEKGAKVVFVNMPCYRNYNEKRFKCTEEFAKSLNVDYINLNKIDEIGIDWKTDSRDGGDHLNYEGAKKVSVWFENYMKELGILTDHRSEESYKSWDTSYDEFLKFVDKSIKEKESKEKK